MAPELLRDRLLGMKKVGVAVAVTGVPADGEEAGTMASDSPPAPAKPESSLRTLASALLDWAFPLMLTAALLLSAAGQYLLTTSKEEDRAILLYAAGVAAFLLAIQTSRRWARRREATAETLGRGNLASRVLMGIGAAILLGASLLMVVNAPSLVLASIFVWGTSLAVAVVTALPVHSPSASPGRRLRLLLSLLSRRETALVGLLVLLGTILRLYDLAAFPSGIHGDEAEHALIALSILDGKGPDPFGTAFLGDRALKFYFEAPFLGLFGQDVVGMRLFSAVVGVLTLPIFFVYVRRLFGSSAALLALALLTGSAVHIHYSRYAGDVTQVLALSCLSFYCLYQGQTRGNAVWWLAAGMAGSFAVYFAFAGASTLVAIALYFAYLLLFQRERWRSWLRGGFLLGIGSIMVLAPVLAYQLGRNDHYTDHMAGRLIFNQMSHVSSVYGTTNVPEILLMQLKISFLAFFSRPDSGPFYAFSAAPMLAQLLGPFLVLGMALALLRFRDSRYALLVVWFWSVVIIGGALTIDPPQTHRLLPALVPAVVVIALCLEWLAENARRILSSDSASPMMALVALIPLMAGVVDNANYFGPAAAAKPWENTTLQAKYLAALGPQYRAYGLGAPHIYLSHGVTRFLAPKVIGGDLVNPTGAIPVPATGEQDLVFMVHPHMSPYMDLLRSAYPGGRIEDVKGKGDSTVVSAFKVSSSEAVANQGLLARYGALERRESSGSDLGGGSGAYPVTAKWTGSLYVERPARYLLRAEGAPTEIRVDGTPIDQSQERQLSTGWHSLEVRAELASAGSRVALKWRAQGQELSPVPARCLDVRTLTGNLRAQVTPRGGQAVERQDRAIGFRNMAELWGIRQPVSARWQGSLKVPTTGQYSFALNSTDPAEFDIDGRRVMEIPQGTSSLRSVSVAVQLLTGSHPIELRYNTNREAGTLELLWTPPGGKSSIIPPEAFTPIELVQ